MTHADITAADKTDDLPAAAFEAIRPEIDALPESNAVQVNVEPFAAVTMVLGRLPQLRALRTQIQTALPLVDIGQFDKLEQYALAFSHAHGVYRGVHGQKGQIAAMANELTVIRDRLYGDAMSLANNGFFSASRLEQCKKSTGYRALAGDILTLVPLFREHWAKVANRTPVTAESLDDAARRTVTFMEVLGMKEQESEHVGEAALNRSKAFTLFLRAYEEARHAVAYLRRYDDDADEIAPSLHAHRGNRRRDEPNEEVFDGPSDSAASTTTKPAEASPAPKLADAPPQIQINNPKNLPIDNPFTTN